MVEEDDGGVGRSWRWMRMEEEKWRIMWRDRERVHGKRKKLKRNATWGVY